MSFIMGGSVKNDAIADLNVSSIPYLPSEVILRYKEPSDDNERWKWISTIMANVSETFLEPIKRDFAPTALRVHFRSSDSIEFSKEGRMLLAVNENNLNHGRLDLEALEAQIGFPGMLSKVQQVDIIANGIHFDLGLSWDLPLVKYIMFRVISYSGCYIEPPSPLQLEHESSLEHLELRRVCSLTAEKLNVLFGTIGSNLKTLKLFQCSPGNSGQRTMSDAELNVIGQHCQQLEVFSVPHSSLITANGISSVLRNNPGVKMLNVQDCPSINGAHLVRVLSQDCQLQTLNLRDNEWLTDSVLGGIIEALPELYTVAIYHDWWNVNVTPDGVRRALQQSSTLGRGLGKIFIHSPFDANGQKAEWKNLAEDSPDVNFSFDW